MAGRFMKIRRVVLPIMSLIILTSQLAGCATLNSQEFMETVNNVDEVVIEYSDLDNTTSNSNVVEASGQQFEVDTSSTSDAVPTGGFSAELLGDQQEDSSIGVVETQKEVELSELSGDALHAYFQKAYDMGITIDGDLEARITGEIDILVSLVEQDATGKLPSDYADQYRAWRPIEKVEVQLFTDANETVYATGTVNIRASYTADSEKLGSLSSGQSVTRTGTAIEGTEAEGWSRVQLSDGSTAYISSKYLSTTKPAAQQQASKPSGQQQQTQQAAKPSGQQQTQQSTSSSQKIDGHDDIGDYIIKNGRKHYPALGLSVPLDFDNKGHNGAPPQTAEELEQAKRTEEAALESPDWHTESWQGVNMG